MSDASRMILGLIIGIGLMIFLVMKTKVHTFIALLLAALVTGLIGGMPINDVVSGSKKTVGVISAIQDGFGSTLKSTGIIIGLGVMMGGILEASGAAERLAFTFIKRLGQKHIDWALAITGWVVAIPVFADSAIVIFAPLVKALSSVTGISVVGLALALACGLQLTHCLVPPTPGPLTAAGMLGVDVGQMIFVGALVSIPMLIIVMFYVKSIGKKIYQLPLENGEFERRDFKKEYIRTMDEVESVMDTKKLPAFGASIAPIIVPILLIFVKTFWDMYKKGNTSVAGSIPDTLISLLGAPIVALGIGTILAIYGLVGSVDKKKVLGIMDLAIKDTGAIMLITGAGGSLGNVIKVAGIGDVLGNAIAATPLPAILIPFIIAACMRLALGSATVAITTAASISAGLIGTISVSPLLMAISSCVGAISFSYFNDSGFWVFNGMFGLSELKDQVRCKTAVSLIMAAVGIVELLLMGLFIR
ncbi:transporter, gluconate:H+ symporter family [Shuttleworthella sp. MSX8B]|uniref:GntP family permease n=1 Tax=Shuttleworthella sp. MSX8B TaxID=936574 RepID=UPI000445F2AD|nr:MULTISPECIES: gluconate:H+ symporter [Shuttleworthia]EUB15774.1 transporter, gluconate:H+ symporter family [Shuttleworthia sp. MSX8B]